MSGDAIVASVAKELETRAQAGYDNYQYPDQGDSYSDDDTDDSPTEKQ